MNKSLLLKLISITLIFFYSCKKENSLYSPKKSDFLYKSKIESFLKLYPIDNITLKQKNDSGIINFKFNSYEEAYNYFKFIDDKKVDTIISIANLHPILNNNKVETIASGVDVLTYTATINSSSSINGTAAGAIKALYPINAVIGFAYTQSSVMGSPKVYSSKSVISSAVSGVTLFYQGTGTATGNAYMICNTATGTLVGNMQGTLTVGPITTSFIITVGGGYSIPLPPAYLASSITIISTLTAQSGLNPQ